MSLIIVLLTVSIWKSLHCMGNFFHPTYHCIRIFHYKLWRDLLNWIKIEWNDYTSNNNWKNIEKTNANDPQWCKHHLSHVWGSQHSELLMARFFSAWCEGSMNIFDAIICVTGYNLLEHNLKEVLEGFSHGYILYTKIRMDGPNSARCHLKVYYRNDLNR